MITVQVVLNFDQEKQIGIMELDETKIPKDMDYCFSLGVRVNKINDKNEVTDCDLIQVSLVHDLIYKQYLDKKYE